MTGGTLVEDELSRLFFPDHPEWNVQVLRLVAEAEFGGADFYECLRTSERIRSQGQTGDAWEREWAALGASLVGDRPPGSQDARESAVSRTHRSSRACNYFRTAEFFLPRPHPRRVELFDAAQRAFRRAIPDLPISVSVMEIAHGNATYEGYVFRGRGATDENPGPGVVFLGGADSYAEELYFFGGRAMADRGITVVVADTPGRGGTLRRQGIPTRPDYEEPASRVMDALAELPFVDPARLGVVGVSLGGYYAPRLAAADERVRALVCFCACFDVLSDLYLFYPPLEPQIEWITGSSSREETIEKLRDFTLATVAQNITCPTLICHGAGDELISPAAATKLYDAVSSQDRSLRLWRGEEGGAIHCNYDNWSISFPYMFDWLQSKLV